MKIKKHIEVRYDEDNKNYIFTPFDTSKINKVTSRMFPILNNKNSFNGVGYAVLDRLGLLEFESIDIYYTIRGAIGEILARQFVEKMYKEGLKVDIETVAFDSQISYDGGKTFYGNDNFKTNPKFGGVLDIAIKSPEAYRAVIEVKSKSLKDYEYIVVKKSPPEEEVEQGLMLAHLSRVDKLLMVYIFFDELQEKTLRNYVYAIQNDTPQPTTEEIIEALNFKIEYFKICPLKYTVNHDEVQQRMDNAYENLHRIAKGGGVISKIHFKNEEIMYLNSVVPKEDLKEELSKAIIEDLPF